MGTWGYELYSNDMAQDVLGETVHPLRRRVHAGLADLPCDVEELYAVAAAAECLLGILERIEDARFFVCKAEATAWRTSFEQLLEDAYDREEDPESSPAETRAATIWPRLVELASDRDPGDVTLADFVGPGENPFPEAIRDLVERAYAANPHALWAREDDCDRWAGGDRLEEAAEWLSAVATTGRAPE